MGFNLPSPSNIRECLFNVLMVPDGFLLPQAFRTLGMALRVFKVPYCLFYFTQLLRHSEVSLNVVTFPCTFLFTQPLGHSGCPMSVLRVPRRFVPGH